jgi:hypothetical protein
VEKRTSRGCVITSRRSIITSRRSVITRGGSIITRGRSIIARSRSAIAGSRSAIAGFRGVACRIPLIGVVGAIPILSMAMMAMSIRFNIRRGRNNNQRNLKFKIIYQICNLLRGIDHKIVRRY